LNRPESNVQLWVVCTSLSFTFFCGVVILDGLMFGAVRDKGFALLVAAAAGLVVGWAMYDGINRRRARPDAEAADYEEKP
jgi:uncharacterized membrane protein SpoIIM required for sporulation